MTTISDRRCPIVIDRSSRPYRCPNPTFMDWRTCWIHAPGRAAEVGRLSRDARIRSASAKAARVAMRDRAVRAHYETSDRPILDVIGARMLIGLTFRRVK